VIEAMKERRNSIMAVKSVPEGYHTVTPYLIVKDVGGLIDFLKQVFGAEERERNLAPDGSVMHAEVRIGDSVVMMASANDANPAMPTMLHLYIEDTDATYRRALAAGANSIREPEDQFYGDRSGGVRDAFGNQWWLSTHIEDVPPDEMERRMKEEAGK
jgi:PhnB protein